jgi:PEP-CTERM motif
MATRSGRSRMRWIAGALASVAVLAPVSAFAIFPPVIQKPTVSVTGVKVQPIVTIQGGHVPPPVVVPPAATTPEPATIVTGLMGLALGGYFLRKKKPVQTV